MAQRKLLAETVGVSPYDVFINLVEVQRENWSFGKGVRAVRPAARNEIEEKRFMAKTVGPFSPWCRIGQTIATSGQIGLGDDGKVVGGGFGPELEQTLRNPATSSPTPGLQESRSSKSMCTWLTSRTGRPSMVPTLSSLALGSQHGPPSRHPRARSVPGSRSRPGPSSRRRDDRA
jgi:enamine deaminase RidA (YjgF/YER057c/UK114 family)